MKVVIMAAGTSLRTYPLTITRPKPMLKFCGKTILEHNLDQLNGIVNEAVIVVNYKAKMIQSLGKRYKGIKLTYVKQLKPLGTANAVKAAQRYVKGKFIVLNGDDLFAKKDIKKCLKYRYCILVKKAKDVSQFGAVLEKNGLVKKIIEKPKQKEGLANTGCYVIDKKIFSIIKNLKKSSRGEYELTDAINKLAEKEKVHYSKATEYWLPHSYSWHLIDSSRELLKRIRSRGRLSKGVFSEGKVAVGQASKVSASTHIQGPVIIGKNCTIGENCFIGPNVCIGDNTEVESNTLIKNSVLFDNVKIESYCSIKDSIVGCGVRIGSGTIIINSNEDGSEIKSVVNGNLINTGRKKLGAIIGDFAKIGMHNTLGPGTKLWPYKTTKHKELVLGDLT